MGTTDDRRPTTGNDERNSAIEGVVGRRLSAVEAVGRRLSAVAPVIAAVALGGLVVAFYLSMRSYRASVNFDARRDLETRAELAAMSLAEPLRTQDFAAVRAFGDTCRERGYELSVKTSGGGKIFDTRSKSDETSKSWVGSSAERDGYRISMYRPKGVVFAPFRRMYRLFVLAALAGAAGMMFFFFAFYRQMVRIRELARLERFRREFVADVSHEIKTPLTGILGAVEMLRDDPADPALRGRLLDMVSKESKRLNELVQQILDLARLEREGEALERADCDLADIAREAVESMRTRAESAGIKLVFAGTKSLTVNCDARLIGEAIGNLIGNAIRHSGSPDVVVSVEGSSRGAVVSVEDHGVGIPPEHASRVFERFHRVDPSRAAESGGAGLGLAIVRRIARLHGGDVVLSPSVPHGCRFALSLPTSSR